MHKKLTNKNLNSFSSRFSLPLYLFTSLPLRCLSLPLYLFTSLPLTILCIFTASCTVWHPIPLTHSKTPKIPEEMLRYYDYPKLPLDTTVVKEEVKKKYIVRQVEFPLHLPEELQTKSKAEWEKEVVEIKKTNEKEAKDRSLHYTNRLDVYLPKKMNGKKPAIVISPILGGNMVVDVFAKYFARHGYVAVIVHRKKTFWDEVPDMKQVEQYMRSSVIRLRQAVDWLEVQPEVDAGKIGGFGVSYGAVLHSILAAIEPRIKFHILAMPAGSLPDVIMGCPDPGVKKLVIQAEKLGWSREKMYSELKKEIKTDPIYFAPYVPKDRVLILLALFDRIVGSSRTFYLWRKMNRPELKMIPLGHYGGILVFPYLERVALTRFRSRL